MSEKKPKDLLAGRELIGFRRAGDGDQIVRRASSAKVTSVETTTRPRPATAPARPSRKSGV